MSNAEWMREINLIRNADWTPAYNRMFDSLRNDENIFRKQEIIYIIEDESEGSYTGGMNQPKFQVT